MCLFEKAAEQQAYLINEALMHLSFGLVLLELRPSDDLERRLIDLVSRDDVRLAAEHFRESTTEKTT
jgi:hypothetical protein